MSGPSSKPKPKARKVTFAPHPDDAQHVRRAFEQDARDPKRRETVTPEELQRWAETGEWPESSD